MTKLTIWVWHRDYPNTNAPWEQWETTRENLTADLLRLMAEYPGDDGFVFELEQEVVA